MNFSSCLHFQLCSIPVPDLLNSVPSSFTIVWLLSDNNIFFSFKQLFPLHFQLLQPFPCGYQLPEHPIYKSCTSSFDHTPIFSFNIMEFTHQLVVQPLFTQFPIHPFYVSTQLNILSRLVILIPLYRMNKDCLVG